MPLGTGPSFASAGTARIADRAVASNADDLFILSAPSRIIVQREKCSTTGLEARIDASRYGKTVTER
jgi:hypothetical protein